MNDHVYSKFPGHIREIQRILQREARFREICSEYEELCTWLASQGRTKPRPAQEYEHARRLIQELENEIRRALENFGS